VRGEHGVESLEAEELASRARLDHAVGVEHDGAAHGQFGAHLIVGLRFVDAQGEPTGR